MFSIRSGMITTSLWTARSTSRWICGELFALDEKISTIARLDSMALTMLRP